MNHIKMIRSILFLAGLFSFVLSGFCDAGTNGTPEKAKNVIILIGDGMGFNADLAGTFYRYGEAGKQRYHSFPVFLGCTTFAMAKKDAEIPKDCKGYEPEVFWASLANANQGTEFTRTTNSSAASTAIHGGRKTYGGSIGLDAQKKPIELISEIAVKLGKKAGTVTTVPLSHATPAAFAAHHDDRGDLDRIFLQMTAPDSPLSVIMGCGHPLYDRGLPKKIKENESEKDKKKRFFCVGGEQTWKAISSGAYNGFTLIETRDRFDELAAGKGDIPKKVIGLPRTQGSIPPSDGFLNDIGRTRELLESSYKNTKWDEMPDLATLSLAAINVLSKENDKGFVLMIEGGAIDGANHGQNMARNVLEHTGFSKAIDAVIDWVEKKSSWNETLVVITSDHETGQLWGEETYSDDNENDVFDEGDRFEDFMPLENKGRGELPGHQYAGKGHSNALVPLWAKGPGANAFFERVRGTDEQAGKMWNFSGRYVDNTDIFHVMHGAMAP